MSLRQLATFPLRNLEGGLVTGINKWVWHTGIGILSDINIGAGGSTRHLVALDGIVADIGHNSGTNGWGWSEQARRLLRVPLGDPEWIYDNRALTYKVSGNSKVGLAGRMFYRMTDRSIYMSANIFAVSPEGVTTFEVDGDDIGVKGDLWVGRGDGEVFIFESGGTRKKCCFYNTKTKTRSSPIYYIGVAHGEGMAYSQEFGVVISAHITPDYHIRIWALEGVPTQVSEPELIDGTVSAGSLATFRVQVLGDADDPCVGEKVEWSLLGAGTLINPQSETDDEGYAETNVRYSLDDEGLETTVKASVVC